jgi:hypothetical protein
MKNPICPRHAAATLFAAALLMATPAVLAGGGCGGSSSPEGAAGKQFSPALPENAEESIEGFGGEASGAERAAILAAEQGYLRALAHKDYATACERLADGVHRSLRRLVAAKERKRVSCAQILPVLLTPEASRVAAVQARGKIVKVRVEGERAFVVFHSPGARLFQFALDEEGGDWRVTTAAPSILAPATKTP